MLDTGLHIPSFSQKSRDCPRHARPHLSGGCAHRRARPCESSVRERLTASAFIQFLLTRRLTQRRRNGMSAFVHIYPFWLIPPYCEHFNGKSSTDFLLFINRNTMFSGRFSHLSGLTPFLAVSVSLIIQPDFVILKRRN